MLLVWGGGGLVEGKGHRGRDREFMKSSWVGWVGKVWDVMNGMGWDGYFKRLRTEVWVVCVMGGCEERLDQGSGN